MSFTTSGLRVSRVRVAPFPAASHGLTLPIYCRPNLFARAASTSTVTATAAATSRVVARTTSQPKALATSPRPSSPTLTPTTTTSTTTAAAAAATQVFSPLLNPPSSTRPPPLDLPIRDPSTSFVTYLYRLGKAYTTFYKTGIKAVFANRRLLASTPAPSSSSSPPTRAHLLLRQRARHDLSRLPLFGLVVFICGELTPLVVLLFPQLTPYTCRIPKQTGVIRRGRRLRRARAARFARSLVDNAGLAGAIAHPSAAGHVCRVLGLTSTVWDRLGTDGPFARSRADAAVRALARDDALIREGGGVAALEDAEVVLACEDRGIDVRDFQEQEAGSMGELRARLGRWVGSTEAPRAEEAEDKVRMLLFNMDETI
ncbi:hypothetical protein F4809DRAFT_663237 [Biscogniauxia mediterranea]|nr:hypothetical protein F4809DRAFT_663237 [Biscogniauxia mediterranea]